MDTNRKNELKYLVGFVASLPFGVAGFLLAIITVIPSPEINKTPGFYVVGLSISALLLGVFYAAFKWSKRQAEKIK